MRSRHSKPARRALALRRLAWLVMALAAAFHQASAAGVSHTVAFVDVNVVPMDRERVLERQTVIVHDGRMTDLGAAEQIVVPKGAQRIDGRGKYLMPGLTDMHVHLKSPHEFPLYLANGVTTVFNLWGRPTHLAWREQIAHGEKLGPTIYTCGPIIFRCDRAEAARQVVEEQNKAGYDSIKIYNDVSSEAYPVLVETARRQHLLVVGHIPRAPGLEGVLKAQQAIAHAEEYIYTFFHDNVDDESRIPEAVAATRAADVPVILTLVNFDHILRQAAELPVFLAQPEMKYLSPAARELWSPALNFYHPRFQTVAQQEYLKKALAFQKTLTRALSRAGVRVLAGTDAMNPGVVPGFSLHEELRHMIESGLSPFETLLGATRYPAEFLTTNADFGTVAIGKRADLLLLDANPLVNIANITRRTGVMVRGRWLPEAELRKALGKVPDDYAREEQFIRTKLAHDPKQALEYFRDNDPFNQLAIHTTANLIMEQGLSRFEKLQRECERNQPDAMFSQEWFINDLGNHLLGLERTPEAVGLFQLNTKKFPRSADAWNSLAGACLKSGDKERAVQYFRKTLELDPKLASAAETLKKLAP